GADPAKGTLGEIEAALAEPDLLLHLMDRGGKRRRLLVGRAQDVEGKPLRRALADPREARQLRDEARQWRWALSAQVAAPPGAGLPRIRSAARSAIAIV